MNLNTITLPSRWARPTKAVFQSKQKKKGLKGSKLSSYLVGEITLTLNLNLTLTLTPPVEDDKGWVKNFELCAPISLGTNYALWTPSSFMTHV